MLLLIPGMLPRLHLFIVLCLSCATAQAEDTAAGKGTENTAVTPVEIEKEEARKQVDSESEDPQSRKTTERQQQAEKTAEPAAETQQATEAEADIDQAREEVKSEEEEPRIDREVITEKPAVAEPYEGRIYGSIRLRYRSTEDGSLLGDAGSRLGLEGEYRTSDESWVYARVEAGFNLLDELDTLLSPGGGAGEGQQGDSFFPRLYTVGIDTPVIVASYGKSWSTYYKISNFTDRFDSAGSSAVGTFNANTDGGSTGTGRADNVFQTLALIDFMREGSRINPFNLNIQFQSSQPIPGVEGVDYQYAFGLSAVVDSRDDYTLGIAYNRAFIDDVDNAAVQAAGIEGDAEAILVGARWFDEKRYIGFTAARLLNHEATDLGTYFNGWGSELYARYRLIKGYWLVAGYNWLTPDEDQVQAGQYELLYGIVGLRYSIDEFNRLAYAEMRLDSTTTESGENLGNIFTIGIRWDF